jgi:DNA-binding XRE family transcriptional regulator
VPRVRKMGGLKRPSAGTSSSWLQASGSDWVFQAMPVIGYLRQRLGMSQLDLALKLGIPRTAVSKTETWQLLPSIASIVRLAPHLERPLLGDH